MPNGDPLILGEDNDATDPTALDGQLSVDGINVNVLQARDEVRTEDLVVNDDAEVHGRLLVGGADEGSLTVRGGLTFRNASPNTRTAGSVHVEEHDYQAVVPQPNLSGVVLVSPHREYPGTVAGRLEGGDLVIELSVRAPSGGLDVAWLCFAVED